MGQYYNVYTEKNGEVKVYNRTVDGNYTMAKLMEHSWWLNSFVSTICYLIHFNPTKIAWVGDYSDEKFEYYDKVWGDKANTLEVTEARVLLWDKYLVNHTTKEYLDCNKYYDECVGDENWCIHPLPLLTAIGNGQGGGDYRGVNKEMVGIWCMNEISVENEKPDESYKEFTVVFKDI